MSPLQYEALYHNLPIPLGDLTITHVDVRRYQNNKEKLRENVNLGNKDALVKKDILINRMKIEAKKMEERQKAIAAGKAPKNEAGVSEGDLGLQAYGKFVHLSVPEILRQYRPKMMTVHSGKGSPWEIQVCLHLIALYKLYDVKTFGNDVAGGVKDYCDKYIGLDCSGFVGSYAAAIGAGKEPNTPISSYAPMGKRRMKLEDVRANDVLAWTDDGHVAVIDSILPPFNIAGKAGRDAVVVESTAGNPSKSTKTAHGGLQHSHYCLRAVDKTGTFFVERPKGGGTSKVFIAPIK